MPSRFYCPDPPLDGRCLLNADESRHLIRVCRSVLGDRIEVFDGRGFIAKAEVCGVCGGVVELRVEGDWVPEVSLGVSLILVTAVPKSDRFDWLVEKATELGVDRLIPLVSERSIVDPRESKLDRLRRSIIEASKQCRRARLMVLDDPMTWTKVVSAFPGHARFLADPEGIPADRWPSITRGSVVVLAVGPEGGYTPSEAELARNVGWLPIRLSQNILRIETAGVAGCAALFTRVPEADE